MDKSSKVSATLLGGLIALGLIIFALVISQTVVQFKSLERTVTVKGLAEREVKADVAIWPVQFTLVDNQLSTLYKTAQIKTEKLVSFLKAQGFKQSELTLSTPAIEDRQAQGYANPNVRFRYAAKVTVSVYTKQVNKVLAARTKIIELAKEDIAISSQSYDGRTEFLFTQLNDIKPEMVQQATKNARQVAEKFAKDSESKLGKIKRASQGQFSIANRDSNSPHVKRVRVVSTLTYYLKD